MTPPPSQCLFQDILRAVTVFMSEMQSCLISYKLLRASFLEVILISLVERNTAFVFLSYACFGWFNFNLKYFMKTFYYQVLILPFNRIQGEVNAHA